MQVSHRVADFQAECIESVFEGLMNRCFLRALKDNIDLTQDIANECVNYSTNVLRNAGGIALLMNAIESAEPKSKSFLSRIANECVAVGCEMSKDMILSDAVKSALEAGEEDAEPIDDEMDETDPEDTTLEDELGNLDDYSASPEMPAEFKNKDISEIQLDTKITEKELNALKQAAAKTDIDAVSNVISDKVSNVLQSEKVQRFKLNEEKERIKTAIMDNPNNDVNDEHAAEAVMNRMLAVPTAELDTSVYNSLFSTLQRRAIESLMAYEHVNIPVSDILTELTVNNTFNIFKPVEKTFESVVERATFMTAAMESGDDAHMEDVIKKATTLATVVYTMLEMLNTTKMNCCGPMDVKAMVTKNAKNVSPTNDVANVVNTDYKRAIEANKRRIYKCTEASDVEEIKANLINTKANLMSARESGIAIKDDVIDQLSNIISIADQRIADLNRPAKESAVLDRMTSARSIDLGNLNLIASSIKYKNFDNIKFKCTECTDSIASFDVYADKGRDHVYKTSLLVRGMEGVELDKYVKYLVSKSKFNGMVKDNEPIDYAVMYDGHVTSF